ncbi:XrtA/PEP-CTERM system-associated ATPase [Nitratidesulfovibrio sp. SRB-5]|uniref:XrtA/PEP-CTERM system-associated ATPase n=1 Tax=Nitratidesulfovibrio sp. SRB-5 TaxID=2872636 RepID=UPI001026B205|nr:XrtA/PEP-CTERM system-associated ATPase [Nitratidesulfovibrio sp. SRB-5]MBZ2172981.1 XrtA-associated ATPase [Nitratidesulfovibrio sp. SRB-5]RXF78484.1 ATPase [Desulfovibrio sp. DS-1]
MYAEFFRFRVKPFDLLPNPDFLFPSRAYRKASAYLEYGVRERAGFILITGEVGAGKTTLIRDLLKRNLGDVLISKVFNTSVDAEQLVAMINDDFGLETEGRDKVTMLRELNEFLINQYAERRRPVLIIDEAQNLAPEVLEEVRMLSNLETDNAKLLQIILVGQPELRERIRSPQLLQLRQRILVQCHLEPLTVQETAEYIACRMERAGNKDALQFEDGVLDEIHRETKGIPRLVNILCGYALLDAYAADRRSVSLVQMQDLLRSMDFARQFWPEPPTVEPATEEVRMQPLPNAPQTAEPRSPVTAQGVASLLLGLSRRVGELEEMQSRMGENAYLDMLDRQKSMERMLSQLSERVDRLGFAQAQRLVQVRQEQPQVSGEDIRPRHGRLWRWFVGG